MNIQEALAKGAARLEAARIDGAERDARILLAHALGREASRLMLMSQDEVPAKVFDQFDTYVTARGRFQPVSQIIGGREFWGRWFSVTRDVLDPRPDTETLIDIALAGRRVNKILDLGTGTGILAVTLAAEWPDALLTATDVSLSALEVAKKNALRHGVSQRIAFQKSDWFENLTGQYDLIVSNPPYISEGEMAELSPDVHDWEPHLALTPGGDGLMAYRKISQRLERFLEPDAVALFEIGYRQGDGVTQIFSDAGFENVTISKDLNGHDRIVTVRR